MSAITRYTFNKNERLTHKPTIDKLFQTKGNRIVAKPLSLIFHEIKLTSESPCQLLISVPKKKFRRAVHRNRIKRLIRESYRMQKHRLYEVLGDSKQDIDSEVMEIDVSDEEETDTCPDDVPTPDAPERTFVSYLDRTQESISSAVESLARNIDDYFTNLNEYWRIDR